MISGVYKLYNTQNSKFYIGSSQDITNRIKAHLRTLKNNTHYNRHLQFSYNKYGDVFNYEILEECSNDIVLIREQHYIDVLNPNYNLCPVAGSTKGYKHTEETRLKMSIASAKRNPSEAVKKQISKTLQGHIITEQTKEKIKQTLLKFNNTLNIKERSELYRNKKNNHTKESKAKISEALKGRLPVNCMKVYMKSIDGKIEKYFSSLREAGRFLRMKNMGQVKRCCNGELESYKGYYWTWI